MSLRILVVDDDRFSRLSVSDLLTVAGHEVEPHETAFTALTALDRQSYDVVLTDMKMPSMDGLQLLKEVRVRHPLVVVIVMTAYGSVDNAVASMKEGADDYLIKPVNFEELRLRMARVEEHLAMRRELSELRRAVSSIDEQRALVCESPAMRQVLDRIASFAAQPSSVLIVGETGTGKELVARALHQRSSRGSKPFVALPCGAIPRDLAESELFGHEKGAFTGAIRRHKGRIELADEGTLFLDDIDDLPLDIQVKVLRVLQERTYESVGGEQTRIADIRVLAASKVPLEPMIQKGTFREDLYYRLNVLTIQLPPLRERVEDILPIAQHFLRSFARDREIQDTMLSPEAADALRAHAWPGNVRELRHAIEHAMALSKGSQIRREDLPESIRRPHEGGHTDLFTLHLGQCERVDLRVLSDAVERDALLWAMKRAEGNQERAAALLNIPRTTLQNKLRQLK